MEPSFVFENIYDVRFNVYLDKVSVLIYIDSVKAIYCYQKSYFDCRFTVDRLYDFFCNFLFGGTDCKIFHLSHKVYNFTIVDFVHI